MPAPGIDSRAIKNYFSSNGNTVLGLLNLFSGSALSRFSVFALGIMPYVTASIILQLLAVVVPKLEQLQKEGEAGYAKINQYTRYLTVVLAALQSLGYVLLFTRSSGQSSGKVLDTNSGRIVLIVVTLTAGVHAAHVDGRADHEARNRQRHLDPDLRLDHRGRAGDDQRLVERRPDDEALLPDPVLGGRRRGRLRPGRAAPDPGAVRARMVGRRMTGGGSTYMPLRVNMAGVIPIIFAAALLAFPPTIGQFFPKTQGWINRNFQPHQADYLLTEAFLIIVFTYFYTAVQFNPVDQADNLRKYGGYIPGIRPGPPTAQYLDRVLSRLTLPGALFLAFIAVFPTCLGSYFDSRSDARDVPRRHLAPDHGRRRLGHDAPDGVADDDAILRGLPGPE